MKLLIVDDEPPARARLRRLLAEHPQVQWVGEAGDGEEALEQLRRHPDVQALILDIQMPGQSGLDLALQLPEQLPVIFCTAFDQHAVQAFELHAVDYLLKPCSPERLATALHRLQGRLHPAQPAAASARGGLIAALQQLQPATGHWLVQRQGRLIKLPLAELQWVCAADNYIELHAPPHSYLERRTLSAFLEHPAVAGQFLRIHRSHAVNSAHIDSLEALPHGEALLTLRGGQQLRVSRNYRDQLRG
ncbi:response regulator [Mitsuaria sp. WAJ17]|uniref:LytR/AlgR family response regulator transcription factor n=1 Tax=Mitsuaria sp. WAJ17 TaxID=2761452 RepID=UPI001602A22C|nr:response regulator [Mitsuaria sp. WAJ17]MBB2486725.1 response regulator [Mitsuaria sp. WAJ17]